MILDFQVRQLMQNYILEALYWLLRQLQIKPNLSGICVASAPFGGHVFALPPAAIKAGNLFPLGKIFRNLLF